LFAERDAHRGRHLGDDVFRAVVERGPDLLDFGARRERAGPLPTVAEFAKAIGCAATDENPSGDTTFVGSTL
jgi:hypothetical protein